MNGIRIHKALGGPSSPSAVSGNCGHFRGRAEALDVRNVGRDAQATDCSQFNSSNHPCKPKHFAVIDLRRAIDIVCHVN